MPTSLDAWLARLEAAHPVGIELGLERVAEVARRMGLTERPIAGRVITVAGTNGKGSTVAMLESLARAHGLTTGVYTSPHLIRYNERLRLDGTEADDATLIAGFEAVEAARLAGEPVSLTYFEVGTLGALWAVARRRPDIALLEVGLGGRLDAVNVIDPDVAVVTTVAQDHAAFLGNDLEIIGREKAGILRAGRPTVFGSSTLPASVRRVAEALDAPVFAIGDAFERRAMADSADACWQWRGRDQAGQAMSLDDLPDPGLPLDNAATALQALALAGVSLDVVACRKALASVTLAGRMQWHGQWCLDVGHNPHAASYLAGRLAALPSKGRTVALLGMLQDKDADGVMQALSPVIDAWVTVSLAGERARSAEDLAERLSRHGAAVWHMASSAISGAAWLASHLAEDDRVLVCGSFFTVGEVLEWLETSTVASRQESAQTEGEDTPSEGT
ncbi:bifunctional folylpolyglutamate synthase/dihydrofolate synthase [Halomonas urumqiensis]|nr:bifunctional folylpolyglutamate synthase/dihydrofolate synthase [Halomonas urumqiensis]